MDFDAVLLPILAALLGLSAFFSASETALFGLTRSDERRSGAHASGLIRRPRELLVAILLGNLAVNTLFFAFAAQLLSGRGALAAGLGNLAALAAVVVLGEVVPKSLALRARLQVARLAAPPLAAVVAALRPVQRGTEAILGLFYRALGEAGRRERGITGEALARALKRSADSGLLLDLEAQILAGIVQLQEVRVREIMTPRVDMLFLDLSEEGRAEVVARALQTKTPWIVVTDGNPDRIVGRVRLRALLAQPARPVREMLEPVKFVPEVAGAVHALHTLRDQRVAQAVAVDEWGGTAGLVTLEHIFEAVMGDLRVEGETGEPAVVELGGGRYEVDGSLSIREWNDQFGRRVVPREFETVGGFVTALLGRIPRPGDVVRAGGLEFQVREVRRRRVVRIELRLEPAQETPA